jgi:hypothetical protein
MEYSSHWPGGNKRDRRRGLIDLSISSYIDGQTPEVITMVSPRCLCVVRICHGVRNRPCRPNDRRRLFCISEHHNVNPILVLLIQTIMVARRRSERVITRCVSSCNRREDDFSLAAFTFIFYAILQRQPFPTVYRRRSIHHFDAKITKQ